VLGYELVPANYREIRLRTACVFQSLDIDPRAPVVAWDVVMMGRYGRVGLLRRPGKRDIEAARSALEDVDAAHLADRPIGQLSGGERQRVNLARALAQEPELLLLDEPTTFLDIDSQTRFRETIMSVHSRGGLTTVVVSHDPDTIADLCENVVEMEM
jgi:ABC-type Mn2+/Zn2+ transport system ATPase subunit